MATLEASGRSGIVVHVRDSLGGNRRGSPSRPSRGRAHEVRLVVEPFASVTVTRSRGIVRIGGRPVTGSTAEHRQSRLQDVVVFPLGRAQ